MSAQDEVDKLFANKEYRSNHPEDDTHSDISDSSDHENTPPTHVPAPRDGPANIPSKLAHGNTGPKGVIRDAQSHRTAQLKAASMASLSLNQGQRDSGTGFQLPETKEEDELDEDAEGFMEQWRRNRLRQMQSGRDRSQGQDAVTPVDGDGYLDAVDKSGADTVVVVYIYDESSEVSQAVESCLRKVARRASSRSKNVKFVKLRYQEAEMEPAGVPALLAYRNGDKFAGLVPLVDEIPDDAELNETTLEVMLQKHQIL